MEPNKFEKQFKEQLNSREIKPSEMAWDRLDAMLTATEKPKRNFKWLYVAASILGFLLVTTVYFNRFENSKIKEDNPVVLEQKKDVNNVNEPKIIKELVLSNQIKNKTKNITEVVAVNEKTNKQSKVLENKEEDSIINQLKSNEAVAGSSENIHLNSNNKYVSAEQLLAEVSNAKVEIDRSEKSIGRNKKGIAVNPNKLLLNAETELNQSYKESALDKFSKNLNTIKTVLVNRNYEE